MRTILFVLLALVVCTAGISFPPRAFAFQSAPLVKFLTEKACSGRPTPFRSGCNGYLHKRITQHKTPAESLEESSNLCDIWYGSEPVKKAQCLQGVQFLNSQE